MAAISAFIDGGPFYDGLRGQGFSADLDYMGLFRELAGEDGLKEIRFYMAIFPEQPYPEKYANQQKLFSRLAAQGIEVIECRTEVREAIFIEHGVTGALSVDLVEGALTGRFDKALLVSRRPEFAPALRAVKKTNCRIKAAFFEYQIDPGNVLAKMAHAAPIITAEHIIRYTLSGPVPLGAAGATVGRTVEVR